MPDSKNISKPNAGLLTVEQACLILGTSVSTVWRLVRDGRLHSWRHWGRTALSQPEVEKLARERSKKEAK